MNPLLIDFHWLGWSPGHGTICALWAGFDSFIHQQTRSCNKRLQRTSSVLGLCRGPGVLGRSRSSFPAPVAECTSRLLESQFSSKASSRPSPGPTIYHLETILQSVVDMGHFLSELMMMVLVKWCRCWPVRQKAVKGIFLMAAANLQVCVSLASLKLLMMDRKDTQPLR